MLPYKIVLREIWEQVISVGIVRRFVIVELLFSGKFKSDGLSDQVKL